MSDQKIGLVADGIYRRKGGMLFERPWIKGKRTWRSLETRNLKLAREELPRRRSGLSLLKLNPPSHVETSSGVIRPTIIRMTSGNHGPPAPTNWRSDSAPTSYPSGTRCPSTRSVPQINIQPAASLHDGGNGCDLGTSLGAADVQPILAVQRQRSNGSFTPVVVDLDPAIAQILFQPTPLFQEIGRA